MKILAKKCAKKILKLIFLFIDFSLRYLQGTPISNSVIIVRTDAIGDYILFRNFLSALRSDSNYQKTYLTLICNIACKDLATNLDASFVNRFIFINKKSFEINIFYRFKFLFNLKKYSYDFLLNPMYSKDLVSETLSKNIISRNKMAFCGDNSNLTNSDLKKENQKYDLLVSSTKELLYEFDRNKEFFEFFLKKKLSIPLEIKHSSLESFRKISEKFKVEKPFAILFIGANISLRKWQINNFMKIATYLSQKYQQNIVFCSGKEDLGDIKVIQKSLSYQIDTKIYNLIGKTSLMELANLIYHQSILISNETSAPHLATALHKTCIVISNGNHLFRFTPPQMYKNYHLILHPDIPKERKKFKILFSPNRYQSKFNINDISPQIVCDEIDRVFENT